MQELGSTKLFRNYVYQAQRDRIPQSLLTFSFDWILIPFSILRGISSQHTTEHVIACPLARKSSVNHTQIFQQW